jgi:hypothetical protein
LAGLDPLPELHERHWAYCVDVDHQATDMAAWRLESVVSVHGCSPVVDMLGPVAEGRLSSWSEAGGRRAMQQHAAGAGGPPSSHTSPPGRPHRFGLVRPQRPARTGRALLAWGGGHLAGPARRRPHPGRRRPPHAQHRWLADRRGSGARLGSPFGCPTRSPRASCRRCEATTSRPTPSATTATPAVYSTSRPPQCQWTLWRHVGTGLVARGERCRTSHPVGDGWHRRHGPGPACCAWTYGHRPDLKGSSCATPSSPSTS